MMHTGDCDSAVAISSYISERRIRSVGFIGTGPMSKWFVPYLEKKNYRVFLTGRTSEIKPEEMIPQVDVVITCIPLSVGRNVLEQYGKLLKPGQALITLAGETTDTVNAALENLPNGVEYMNVHNLFGPLATNMENKNVSITKTSRSGPLCEEFESLFHEHGANVIYDSPEKHDLMMDIEQRVTTVLSIAFGRTIRRCIKEYGITLEDIRNHSTLTSIYPILGMARIYDQTPRTYAELLTSKKATETLRIFREEFDRAVELGQRGDIETLEQEMKETARDLGENFLKEMLELSLEVDDVLSKPRKREFSS